jgi:cytochrome c biogenesis protein CcmG, thiol:disulfide interchange protein DsbE
MLAAVGARRLRPGGTTRDGVGGRPGRGRTGTLRAMSGRLAVLVGLLAGLATAAVVFVAAIIYAPAIADALYPTQSLVVPTVPPTVPPRATPSAAASGNGGSPSAAASPGAGTSPGASGSPAASGPPAPSAVPSPGAPGSPAGSATPAGSASAGSGAFRIGEPAPPLTLPLLGGGTVDLAQLRGNAVWVNFMATWCEPCRDEFPLMSVFQARYEDEGLIVLAVDVREDPEAVAAFVEEARGVFRVALDTDGEAQREWGALALPIHFWVDADGIIRDGALGGIGPDDMARSLRTILPGVEVTPP